MDLRPTARDLRWFAQIDRHGPQSSEFLYALTRDTHVCKDTALRRLQALRAAGYLHLPAQQRQIAKADFNPFIYDLTPLGWELLATHKRLERPARPTGHWWHAAWVAAITSAIEIKATRAGLQYIPAAQILAIKDVPLAIPLPKGKLIPDQLFALKYPDGYRAFALEVDRGTEPLQSTAARKSLRQSIAQYRTLLQNGLHQQHYGLKSPLLVLFVFNNPVREQRFAEMVQRMGAAYSACFLSQHVTALFPRWEDCDALVTKGWQAAGSAPVQLLAG
jgi:hypothetical protein